MKSIEAYVDARTFKMLCDRLVDDETDAGWHLPIYRYKSDKVMLKITIEVKAWAAKV